MGLEDENIHIDIYHTHTYFLIFLGVLTVTRPDFSEGDFHFSPVNRPQLPRRSFGTFQAWLAGCRGAALGGGGTGVEFMSYEMGVKWGVKVLSNAVSFRGWCVLYIGMTIDRDNMNRKKDGRFLWGIEEDQPTKPIQSNIKPTKTNKTNPNQTTPNQTKPNQTIPHQPDIPNQTKPTTSIHHFPPPSSYTSPTTTVLFQGLRSAAHGCLEEFGEMDVVEFASAEVGCCGFSSGLKAVGWMVFVYNTPNCNCWLWNFI